MHEGGPRQRDGRATLKTIIIIIIIINLQNAIIEARGRLRVLCEERAAAEEKAAEEAADQQARARAQMLMYANRLSAQSVPGSDKVGSSRTLRNWQRKVMPPPILI
jgi:hypothetical protein